MEVLYDNLSLILNDGILYNIENGMLDTLKIVY